MSVLVSHAQWTEIGIVAITVLIGVAVLGRYVLLRVEERRHRGADGLKRMARHCRYCFFGRARLSGETVRIEDDDLVEVRCFVCSSCGLPQWTVHRSPVLNVAER
jgi:hypothetical protein